MVFFVNKLFLKLLRSPDFLPVYKYFKLKWLSGIKTYHRHILYLEKN